MKPLYEGILSGNLDDKIDMDVKARAFLKFAKKWNESTDLGDDCDAAGHEFNIGDPVLCLDGTTITFGLVSGTAEGVKIPVDVGGRIYKFYMVDCIILPINLALDLAKYLKK